MRSAAVIRPSTTVPRSALRWCCLRNKSVVGNATCQDSINCWLAHKSIDFRAGKPGGIAPCLLPHGRGRDAYTGLLACQVLIALRPESWWQRVHACTGVCEASQTSATNCSDSTAAKISPPPHAEGREYVDLLSPVIDRGKRTVHSGLPSDARGSLHSARSRLLI